MSYQQDPSILQAIAEWLRSQANRPDQQPGNLVRPRGHSMGFSQAQAEEGYARDAAAAQQQYGMFNDGSPNALQGGMVGPGPEMFPNPDYPGPAEQYQPGDAPMRQPQGGSGIGGALDSFLGPILRAKVPGTGFLDPGPVPPVEYPGASDDRFSPQNAPLGRFAGQGEAGVQARGEDAYDAVTGALSPALEGTGFTPPGHQKPVGAKKSKSEFGDFFKLLKKAKSGDENTKSKISELAKQLDDEELSASGGTIPVV